MTQRFKRDDGVTEVEVDYEVESYGSPNFDHPGHICDGGGEPAIINITEVTSLKTGEKVELTEKERERIEGTIAENLEPPGEFEDYE